MPPKFQQPLLPRAKPAAPRREAGALAYEHGRVAPRVAAKGRGDLAETIIARAKDAGLFVHESPELVALLMQVDLDKTIPAELYQAVAEILAFVYYLEREAKGKNNLDAVLAEAKQAGTLPAVTLPPSPDAPAVVPSPA